MCVYLVGTYIEIYVRSHTVGGKVEKFYNLYLYELGYGFGLKWGKIIMHNIKIDGLCIYFLKVLHIIYLGRVQNIYLLIQNDEGPSFSHLSSKIFGTAI